MGEEEKKPVEEEKVEELPKNEWFPKGQTVTALALFLTIIVGILALIMVALGSSVWFHRLEALTFGLFIVSVFSYVAFRFEKRKYAVETE